MKMLREHLKTFLLIFLIVAAIYQTGRLWLSSSEMAGSALPFSRNTLSFLKAIGILPNTPPITNPDIRDRETVFLPVSVSFKLGEEIKTAIASKDSLQSAMEESEELIRQALSQSSLLEKRTAGSTLFTQALVGDGIIFDLGKPVSTGILTGLLGVGNRFEGANDLFIEYIFIALGERQATVYLLDTTRDETCTLKSDIDSKKLKTLLETAVRLPGFVPSTLAQTVQSDFSDEDMKIDLSPYIVVTTDPIPSGVLISQNPIYSKEQGDFRADSLHSALAAFFYNPYSTRSYTQSDGSLVYVENDSTLRFTQQGLAEYRASSPQKGIAPQALVAQNTQGVVAMVEASYALISRFESSICGGDIGSARFSKIEYLPEKECYRVTMDYVCDGITIRFANSEETLPEMAVLDFSPEGELFYARVYLRHYSSKQYVVNNIPQTFAVRILAADKKVDKKLSGLNLCYIDDHSGTVYTQWVARERAGG